MTTAKEVWPEIDLHFIQEAGDHTQVDAPRRYRAALVNLIQQGPVHNGARRLNKARSRARRCGHAKLSHRRGVRTSRRICSAFEGFPDTHEARVLSPGERRSSVKTVVRTLCWAGTLKPGVTLSAGPSACAGHN